MALGDTDELELALTNPKGFLEIHPWPVLIDEEREKRLDSGEKRQIMYVLTGSNRFELQEGISESLAGRVAVLEMGSLTQMEGIKKQGSLFHPNISSLLEKERRGEIPYASQTEMFERTWRGGMPEIVVNKAPRDLYFKSYLDTYLEKDVRKLISASSEMAFRRFLSYLALRTAQQVNHEVFARELGINLKTCKRWISILQASGIIILLEPYMAPNLKPHHQSSETLFHGYWALRLPLQMAKRRDAF